jgi:hypothetical protein
VNTTVVHPPKLQEPRGETAGNAPETKMVVDQLVGRPLRPRLDESWMLDPESSPLVLSAAYTAAPFAWRPVALVFAFKRHEQQISKTTQQA